MRRQMRQGAWWAVLSAIVLVCGVSCGGPAHRESAGIPEPSAPEHEIPDRYSRQLSPIRDEIRRLLETRSRAAMVKLACERADSVARRVSALPEIEGWRDDEGWRHAARDVVDVAAELRRECATAGRVLVPVLVDELAETFDTAVFWLQPEEDDVDPA